jgi:hypothetical protein
MKQPGLKRRIALALWRVGIRWGPDGEAPAMPGGPDWSSNVGRGGLRFSERVRDVWRRRWLRLRRPEATSKEHNRE